MYFQLDLAIAYVCLTGLCFFFGTLIVPLVFGTVARAILAHVRPSARVEANEPRTNRQDGDWWGPVHQSH